MRCGSRRPTRVRHRVPASVARDAATERERLRVALDAAAAELTALAAEAAGRAGEDVGAIFEAQALFARDPGIVDPALAAIDDGATAEEAIDRVSAAQADALAAVDDEYFRERAADLRDVGRRVVDRLTGRERPPLHRADGSPAVLVADDLDPSVVVAIRPEMVTGIALAGGAPTGHAAIVARALGIPLVLGLGAAVDARLDGAEVAVDGSGGRLLVEPDEADLEAMTAGRDPPARSPGAAAAICLSRSRRTSAPCARRRPRRRPARTASASSGRSCCSSAGPCRPGSTSSARSTAGSRRRCRAAASSSGRSTSAATSPRPISPTEPEMNPALGVRGIRARASPIRTLFETQLRALLEAVPAEPRLDPPADGRDGRGGGRGPRGARPGRRCVGAGGRPRSRARSVSG